MLSHRATTSEIVVLKLLILALALTLAEVSITRADISFEWVTVADPGNPSDPLTDLRTPYETPPTRGAVPYVYNISKYETTIGQYAAFPMRSPSRIPNAPGRLYSSSLS